MLQYYSVFFRFEIELLTRFTLFLHNHWTSFLKQSASDCFTTSSKIRHHLVAILLIVRDLFGVDLKSLRFPIFLWFDFMPSDGLCPTYYHVIVFHHFGHVLLLKVLKVLKSWSLGSRIPTGRRPSFGRVPSWRMGPTRVLEGRCPFLQWTVPTRIDQVWTDDPLRSMKPPLSGHTHHSFAHVIHNYEGGNPRTYSSSTPWFLQKRTEANKQLQFLESCVSTDALVASHMLYDKLYMKFKLLVILKPLGSRTELMYCVYYLDIVWLGVLQRTTFNVKDSRLFYFFWAGILCSVCSIVWSFTYIIAESGL